MGGFDLEAEEGEQEDLSVDSDEIAESGDEDDEVLQKLEAIKKKHADKKPAFQAESSDDDSSEQTVPAKGGKQAAMESESDEDSEQDLAALLKNKSGQKAAKQEEKQEVPKPAAK